MNRRLIAAIAALVATSLVPIAPAQSGGRNATGAASQNAATLVGRWVLQNEQMRIVDEVRADGSFHEDITSLQGTQSVDGVWRVDGNILTVQANGNTAQSSLRFDGANRLYLTYPNGMTVAMDRVSPPAPPARQAAPQTPAPAAKPAANIAKQSPGTPVANPAKAKLPRIVLHRTREPAQNAFTVLVPQGWQISGGMFNVNPLEMDGACNSLVPKTDFAVKSDARGTVMIRWLPGWSYADLRRSGMGQMFQPGQKYQGMPVRNYETPAQFLSGLFQSLHPNARNARLVGQDPMNELTQAFAKQYEQTNQAIVRMGMEPMRFDSLAVFFEYEEDGVTYSEILFTTEIDNTHGAFMWSNENTIQMRAPKASAEQWKGVLDMIRDSVQLNPEWVALIQKHSQIRADIALDTQRYINRVTSEIAENRARTNSEINHENWLLLTGQEEYKNPYTGEVERGSNEYAHRWQNASGDVIYSNENSFDPNRAEEFNSNEWKRSEVAERK